mmetsp:Transcript_59894/g.160339  ORF Transcript_59894/g.160339 Transcript_59894/m.160339 type:complete len:284 (-) Transcript_59894:184-1035(-)
MISPPTMPAPAWAAGVGAVARQEAMAGALGGVSATGVAMFVSHPLDTLKTRVQAKGWGASAKELARQPFYGIGPHVAWYSLFNMVRFSCFCSLRGCAERSTGLTGWHSAAVAGAGAGLVTGVTLHPFFVIKAYQQVTRTSISVAYSTLVNAESLFTAARGFPLACVRFPIGVGALFSVNEVLRPQGAVGWLERGVASGLAGAVSTSLIMPLDVVQSKLMSQRAGRPHQYKGAWDCARQLLAEEGPRAFSAGYSVALARAVCTTAILLPTCDSFTEFFRGALQQ